MFRVLVRCRCPKYYVSTLPYNNFQHTAYKACRWEAEFAASQWFKRGWTLQELLAPDAVHFYDRNFRYLGDRNRDRKMLNLIQNVTAIPEGYLVGEPLRYASVAQRMSWAAERQTTRIEDTAYCLLGIFDVNMPLLYGEGEKAFLRLQREILSKTDDESIFAWTLQRPSDPRVYHPGSVEYYSEWSRTFASSPAEFTSSGGVRVADWTSPLHRRPPYAMTNKGLEVFIQISNTNRCSTGV